MGSCVVLYHHVVLDRLGKVVRQRLGWSRSWLVRLWVVDHNPWGRWGVLDRMDLLCGLPRITESDGRRGIGGATTRLGEGLLGQHWWLDGGIGRRLTGDAAGRVPPDAVDPVGLVGVGLEGHHQVLLL